MIEIIDLIGCPYLVNKAFIKYVELETYGCSIHLEGGAIIDCQQDYDYIKNEICS